MKKQIPNFKEYYTDKQGNIWSFKFERWKKLTPRKHRLGYRTVVLFKDKKRHQKYIHHLILETFVSKCPFGMEACHNDGVLNNNKLNNLRWDTKSNNMKDKLKHGTLNTDDLNTSKLNIRQVNIIRYLYHNPVFKVKIIELAKIFDVDRTTISKIANNKTWVNI